MPLKPSGQTPTSSPELQQPLGVLVARQRRAGLARQRRDDRHREHQVGGEHPQVPVRRVVVVQRELRHRRVDRDRAGVVGDDQRAAVGGHVLHAAGLDPEVLLVERPQRRQRDVVGEVGVEAELVDLVVAGDPAAQERQAAGELALPVGAPRRLVDRGSTGGGRLGRAAARRGRAPTRRDLRRGRRRAG